MSSDRRRWVTELYRWSRQARTSATAILVLKVSYIFKFVFLKH